MGLIGTKRDGWNLHACEIKHATHLYCFETGYMDDGDEDGNLMAYALKGKFYKIEKKEEHKGSLFIHSECVENREYGNHAFPIEIQALRKLGLIPVRR